MSETLAPFPGRCLAPCGGQCISPLLSIKIGWIFFWSRNISENRRTVSVHSVHMQLGWISQTTWTRLTSDKGSWGIGLIFNWASDSLFCPSHFCPHRYQDIQSWPFHFWKRSFYPHRIYAGSSAYHQTCFETPFHQILLYRESPLTLLTGEAQFEYFSKSELGKFVSSCREAYII